MYEQFKGLKIERKGAVLWVTLDNPPLNAMTPEAHNDFAYLFQVIARDPDTRAVVVTGGGTKGFSAGGNIQTMHDELKNHARWCAGMIEAREIVQNMLACDKPVIARINGHAIGVGATIALCCDITLMIDSGKIGDTHVKIGLVAGDGGAILWPHLIGIVKARRYLLSGDLLSGKEAAEIGLVTESCATFEDLDARTEHWANILGNGATVALAGTKRALNMTMRLQAQAQMDTHMGLETVSQLSEDHAGAVLAFLEKREPKFEGR